MTDDHLAHHRRLIACAIDTYLRDPEGFSFAAVATACDIPEEGLTRVYADPDALLTDYYIDALMREEELSRDIEGFATFSLEEKVSTFIYTLFDQFDERADFVRATLPRLVLDCGDNPFKTGVARRFRTFLEQDPDMPAPQRMLLLNGLVYNLLCQEYLVLLRFWIQDDSPGAQRTMALADKLVAFQSELAQTPILDRGLDLARYLVSPQVLKWPFPFLSRFFDRT